MDLGKELGSGRTASVHEIDAGRVLKRYVIEMPIAREVAAMRHVTAHGYPAPDVYGCDDWSIVMSRVDGPTMAAGLASGEISPAAAAATLACLHERLHALPPMHGAAADGVAFAPIHLDLHPENVIMSENGPVVIDWANAADGQPDLDLAVTALILAQASLDPMWAALPAADVLDEFAARAGGAPMRGLDEALAMRKANPTMSPAELDRLPAAGDMVAAAFRRVG